MYIIDFNSFVCFQFNVLLSFTSTGFKEVVGRQTNITHSPTNQRNPPDSRSDLVITSALFCNTMSTFFAHSEGATPNYALFSLLMDQLRATEDQAKALIDLGLETEEDLCLLTEADILKANIKPIHFRRAVQNGWSYPNAFAEAISDIVIESTVTLPSGHVAPIEDLKFNPSYDDITVEDPTTGERVVAEGAAECNGRSVRYKCMCDCQLAQALIMALRVVGMPTLPTSPANFNEAFHLKKLLDVGDIPLSSGTSYMYAAHVSGKDVFFNILQRAGSQGTASAEPEDQAYGIVKEWLNGMLNGQRFRTEYGGIANPPDATEQGHIRRYTGALDNLVGQVIALYNSTYSGFVQMTNVNDSGAMGVQSRAKDTPRLLQSWLDWERFLVVDGGNGKVCLFNLHHRKFVRVMGADVNAASVREGPGDLPCVESWPSERFTVVDGGNGTVAFHNAHHNRFMRLCDGRVDALGGVKSITDFPRTWTAERFEVIHHPSI